jgi:hypothetical protein
LVRSPCGQALAGSPPTGLLQFDPWDSWFLPLAQYAFLWMMPCRRVIHRMRRSSQGVQCVM